MTRIPPILLIVPLLLLLGAPAPSLAGDEETEDSAAGRLFREAWWIETGTGALDKAHAAYEKALAAEGSSAVRGRALYRMAVVLQRMGRTEEGVRALERLAREFPGERALLAKAKERLEEWTAEDLRTSFGEWYKRYQYSPAFQAKIIDLVLVLGTGTNVERAKAEQELLTIGEPAIPALKQHATSANASLKAQVVSLLLRMGTLPPLEALKTSYSWMREVRSWALIRDLPEESREELRAFFDGDDSIMARVILAVFAGAKELVDVIAEAPKQWNYYCSPWFALLQQAEPTPSEWARFRALVLDEDLDVERRHAIAAWLVATRGQEPTDPHPAGLTDAEVLTWTDAGVPGAVRMQAWRHLTTNRPLAVPDAWRVPARVLEAGSYTEQNEPGVVWNAFVWTLRRAPDGQSLEPAIETITRTLNRQGTRGLDNGGLGDHGEADAGARVRALVTEGLKRATGPAKLHGAVRWWWHAAAADERVMGWLADLAANARSQDVRLDAAETFAGSAAAATDLEGFLRGVDRDDRRGELRSKVVGGLAYNKRLTELAWSEEALAAVVRIADTQPDRQLRGFGLTVDGNSLSLSTRLAKAPTYLFARLLRNEPIREKLLRAAAGDPVTFTADVWLLQPPGYAEDDARIEHAVGLLDAAWDAYTPEQRRAALRVLLSPALVGKAGSARKDRFLHERLKQPGLDEKLRVSMLTMMDKLTLGDVQRVFDLSTPSGVDAAAQLLPKLPTDTEAVYDAFVLALRPDAGEADWIAKLLGRVPDSRRHDLVRRLLANQDEQIVSDGVRILMKDGKPADRPLWIECLSHRHAFVRSRAATALASMYDQAAIQALAKAVDDPDGAVQNAALKSLAFIEKREKEKAHWRAFAAGKRKLEDEK